MGNSGQCRQQQKEHKGDEARHLSISSDSGRSSKAGPSSQRPRLKEGFSASSDGVGMCHSTIVISEIAESVSNTIKIPFLRFFSLILYWQISVPG